MKRTPFSELGPLRVRFAPSPTGELHLGNARTALLNRLAATKSGGTSLVRVEDTDQARSKFAYEIDVLSGLLELGLAPDEPYWKQTMRLETMNEHAGALWDSGWVYPCFCSEETLERERLSRLAAGLPPRYSGCCAKLSNIEARDRIIAGEPYALRFRVEAFSDGEAIVFDDWFKGETRVPPDAFGDFLVIRTGGVPNYNFAAVFDDQMQGITCVLRGEDHLTNTARQILLHKALAKITGKGRLPRFAHHGLLVDSDHKKLSKRGGALSVRSLLARGIPAGAVVAYLASLGGGLSPDGLEAVFAAGPGEDGRPDMHVLAEHFSFDAMGSGPAVFVPGELERLAEKWLHKTPAPAVRRAYVRFAPPPDWFAKLSEAAADRVVDAARANATGLADLSDALAPFHPDGLAYPPEAVRAILDAGETAKSLLDALREGFAGLIPPDGIETISPDAIQGLFKSVQTATGIKGKSFWKTLRLVLTGREHGPELAALLAAPAPADALARIDRAKTLFSR